MKLVAPLPARIVGRKTRRAFASLRPMIRLVLGTTAMLLSTATMAAPPERTSLWNTISPNIPTDCPGCITVGPVAASSVVSQANNGSCNRIYLFNNGTVNPGTTAITKTCSSTNPIVLKAVNTHGVTVKTNNLVVTGQGVVIYGFKFDGVRAELKSHKNKIKGSKFINSPAYNVTIDRGGAVLVTGGQYNAVVYNEFSGHYGIGVEVVLGKQQSTVGTSYNYIAYNYIHDPRGSGNGHESIRVLTHAYVPAYNLVEKNYLYNVDIAGESEAMSIKSNNNIIYANTLKDSTDMRFSSRQGSSNSWLQNRSVNSQGFKFHGDSHVVSRNKLTVTGDMVFLKGNTYNTYGTQPLSGSLQVPRFPSCSNNESSSYPAARYAVVTDNNLYSSGALRTSYDDSRGAQRCVATSITTNSGNGTSGLGPEADAPEMTSRTTGPAALPGSI